MVGIDFIDERSVAYHLDQKSTLRLYLNIMLNLMGAAFANSYIVYNMMHPNYLTLLNFNTTVSNYLTKDTQVEAEHHQKANQVPSESISVSLK